MKCELCEEIYSKTNRNRSQYHTDNKWVCGKCCEEIWFYHEIHNQPERLNPEDISWIHKAPVHDWGKLWNVCDSLNTTNE